MIYWGGYTPPLMIYWGVYTPQLMIYWGGYTPPLMIYWGGYRCGGVCGIHCWHSVENWTKPQTTHIVSTTFSHSLPPSIHTSQLQRNGNRFPCSTHLGPRPRDTLCTTREGTYMSPLYPHGWVHNESPVPTRVGTYMSPLYHTGGYIHDSPVPHGWIHTWFPCTTRVGTYMSPLYHTSARNSGRPLAIFRALELNDRPNVQLILHLDWSIA